MGFYVDVDDEVFPFTLPSFVSFQSETCPFSTTFRRTVTVPKDGLREDRHDVILYDLMC